MAYLTDKQIEYGFDYFHQDEPQSKCIVEVSEYKGESTLTINCTQLGDSFTPQYKTAKEKKRVVKEWCDFLTYNPTAFTELTFCTRIPQDLFDAVCAQQNLKKLHIKWGVYPDISRLAQLSKLEYLHLGSGASVESIEPIAKLNNLLALSVENFQKIDDYSPFANLKKLESLSIEGDCFAPKNIHVNSFDFLNDMKQLRYFNFLAGILKNKDYTPILNLENIEHLTLKPSKELKDLYDEIIKLPKLKYGSLVNKPELYLK